MPRNQYTDLIRHFQHASPSDPALARRLSELISLNELVTTLHTIRSLEAILDVVLLTILGEFPSRQGVMLIRQNGQWSAPLVKGIKTIPQHLHLIPAQCDFEALKRVLHHKDSEGTFLPFLEATGLQCLFPMRSDGELVGMIALGGCLRNDDESKCQLVATMADFAGIVLGNYLYRSGLEGVNRQLQRRIFQLNSLYEIAGSFARCYEAERVYDVLAGNIMGQFFISRCAVFEIGETTQLVYLKGLRDDGCLPQILLSESDEVALGRLLNRDGLQNASLIAYMKDKRLQSASTILVEGKVHALILLGGRLDGRALHEEDVDFLESLIQQAGVALENLALQLEVLEKKRMEKELELAREIQQRLLPKSIPIVKGYDIAVEMRPYQQVGGDFYDLIPFEDGRLALCMADVSGKSLPASMIMTTTQASLRALTSFPLLSLVEVMTRLNQHIYMSTQTNKYVTMFFAILDPQRHELCYINAGHNRPILLRPDGSFRELDCGGMVIGMFPKAPYEFETVAIEPGTELLIFTDGLSEIMDSEGEEYGEERLVQKMLSQRGMDCAESLKQTLITDVLEFGGHRMIDDLTIMVLRRSVEHG